MVRLHSFHASHQLSKGPITDKDAELGPMGRRMARKSGVGNQMSFVTAQREIGVGFDTAGLSCTCGLTVRFLSVSVLLVLDTTPDDPKLVAHTDATRV